MSAVMNEMTGGDSWKTQGMSRYERLETLGQGVFGTVHLARDHVTGELVAVKRFHSEDEYDGGLSPTTIREVSLLCDIVHPNIVRLLDLQLSNVNDVDLIMEYLPSDLHRELRADGEMPMSKVRSYARDLLDGIHACHISLVLHRDLKPQNILVGPQGLKIGDFGLARMFSVPIEVYTHDVVTLWYRAPEILLGSLTYGPEVDMWSIGSIIAEMATGRPLFDGRCEIETLFKILQLVGTPTEESWPRVSTLQFFKFSFPQWRGRLTSLKIARPELGDVGMVLLQGLLMANPQVRFNASVAKRQAFVAVR